MSSATKKNSNQLVTPKARLDREFKQFALSSKETTGIRLNTDKMESTGNGWLNTWFIEIDGAEGTLYAGKKFELQLKFNSNYPFESPEVTFTGAHIPIHPHVYSNGHICLSILADDWSPALGVFAICISIQSMLSSCKEKKRPPDDEDHVRAGKSAKETSWYFHDNEV